MTSHANNTGGTEGYTGLAMAQAAFRKNDLLRSYHLYIASTPNRVCHGFIGHPGYDGQMVLTRQARSIYSRIQERQGTSIAVHKQSQRRATNKVPDDNDIRV